ncbi:ABC transporter ATP-binding protein [Desertimonas flava]|uniref:ABC transporter ATP-binding protein n=1 Tax=Desertimonas flava TaxID=2064846 RepID=UPI000E34C8E1|nr:ABC transporter ATP-binding protein [Desertimonas flava]
MTSPLLELEQLQIEAACASGRIVAVDGIDLSVGHGEVVGLIGESGSGKTTIVRSVVDLLERNVEITDGRMRFDGEPRFDRSAGVDRRAGLRGAGIGMIFQQPRASLDPVLRIETQLREVIGANEGRVARRVARERSCDVLAATGLDPVRVLRAYPHQLSGGMCQRVAIALAVVSSPRLLIADECTSALDVTTQREVVLLLRRLVAERSMSMVFVTHDLMLASEVCDRIVVLRSGRVVEQGPVADVFGAPAVEYTRQLLAAVPRWAADSGAVRT